MATKPNASAYSVFAFRTSIGWCGIAGRDHSADHALLSAVTIGQMASDATLAHLQHVVDRPMQTRSWNASLARRIEALLEGEPDDFCDVQLDLDHLAPFSKRVVHFCRKLVWGQTASYAELANLAGSPGAARAVGQVMAGNRMPLVVPCHRVVGAGGRLGGFSAPQGLSLKRRLLDMESGPLGKISEFRPSGTAVGRSRPKKQTLARA